MNEKEIQIIKDSVRKRDKYRCVECGRTDSEHLVHFGTKLHVHRVTPGSDYSLNGCVTLCEDCHKGKPKSKWHTSKINKVTFKADPDWIERATKEASLVGLGLSAFIRVVATQYMDAKEIERRNLKKK